MFTDARLLLQRSFLSDYGQAFLVCSLSDFSGKDHSIAAFGIVLVINYEQRTFALYPKRHDLTTKRMSFLASAIEDVTTKGHIVWPHAHDGSECLLVSLLAASVKQFNPTSYAENYSTSPSAEFECTDDTKPKSSMSMKQNVWWTKLLKC